MQRDHFAYLLKTMFRTEVPSITVLDESFETLQFCLVFTRNLPYSETFIKKINEMIASGLAKKFIDADYKKHILSNKEEGIGPQVLTLDTLWLGFVSFLIASGLSTVAFIIERWVGCCCSFKKRDYRRK
jgi:hypothetical protein